MKTAKQIAILIVLLAGVIASTVLSYFAKKFIYQQWTREVMQEQASK